MKILVPAKVHSEFIAENVTIPAGVELIPYSETDGAPAGAEEAVAVCRWTAGKAYAPLVENGENVRWLHTASAGTDHVITPKIREKQRLAITDTGPAYEIAIGEFVLAWMLAVTRKLPLLWERQREKRWEWLTQDELYGKTVGIIGLGPIGRGIAQRSKAFGMKTIGLRRRPIAVEGVDEVLTGPEGLQRVIAKSDFVVLAAALTTETRAIIGADELAQMKTSAWLINIARGEVVDQTALLQALQAGVIAGACLDVFEKEPLPLDHPFWEMSNVLIAPHSSSGWSAGLHARQKTIFLENLKRFANDEALENVVDLARGY